MAIKKYFATADTTISNAFDQSLITDNKATGSNMGEADILEIFQLYGQVSSSTGPSSELSRVLIQFDIDDVKSDRTAGAIPALSNVNFYLKMYNAKHPTTTPEEYKLAISAVSQSWQEGNGLDMVNYTDKTYGLTGSTWNVASSDKIQEVTKFSFSGGTRTHYSASNGVNYVELYNYETLYNLWFSASAGDHAGSSGNWIEVNISSDDTVNAIATTFKTTIDNSSPFSANIIGNDVYVTSSTNGKATAPAVTSSATNPLLNSALGIEVETSGANQTSWSTAGGDYWSTPTYDVYLTGGYEDIEVDVTTLVEQWIAESKENYGFGVALSASYEQENKSYYTKKFFARGTEFYYKRPVLEARWDDSRQDDRESFFLSSSLAPAEDNLNTIYLYNRVRGRLRNIPTLGTDAIYVSIFSGSADNTEPSGSPLDMVIDGTHVATGLPQVVTGAYVSTGVYAATFAFTGSSALTKVYDVWFSGSNSLSNSSGATQFHTGTIGVNTLAADIYNPSDRYILSLSNLRESYGPTETARFKVYARPRDWNPTIYTKAINKPETTIITSASYEVYRASDGLRVVAFGTGSDYHTGLSYNVSGNYFDLDMSNLEKDQMYGIRLAFYDDAVGSWNTQPYEFKFKVRNDEY